MALVLIYPLATADLTREGWPFQPTVPYRTPPKPLSSLPCPALSMSASRPQEIRHLVQQRFAELSPSAGPIEAERLLIRNGQYCGHRYLSSGLAAVWFLEEDEIKIYDERGHVLDVCNPSQAAMQRRPEAA
jgi:hypothetical protein